MSIDLRGSDFISSMFKPVVLRLVREQGKKCGALLFSLNFLWLLSLFQDKESDNKDSLRKREEQQNEWSPACAGFCLDFFACLPIGIYFLYQDKKKSKC